MTTTILHGCALTQLASLPDNSVDCVVTSPPYWGLRDYGIPASEWPLVSFAPMPGLAELEIPAEVSCLGLEPRLDAFIGHIVLIFREIRRVLKDTGTCWVNMGDGYAGSWGSQGRDYGNLGESTLSARKIAASAKKQTNTGSLEQYCGLKAKDLQGQPWRVAFALQADGWYLRSDIIWHKPNPMPESTTDRATKSHEYFFMLTKSERYFFDQEAWAERCSEGTHARLSQNVAAQIGSARANGGIRAHRPMKAVGKAQSSDRGRIKNNASMDAALAVMPMTRNKRTVWSVPTCAYKEAHYATYPPDLIRPCIRAGSSGHGVCPHCGKPWIRTKENTGHVNERKPSRVPRGHTQTKSKGWAPVTRATQNWQPTCQCPEHRPMPSVVLDPFGGSGTTAQVALEEARQAILIEAGEHNIELIRKRLAQVTPSLPLA